LLGSGKDDIARLNVWNVRCSELEWSLQRANFWAEEMVCVGGGKLETVSEE
jgi:hypothetical protein